jgi:hypothetical protein
VLLLVFGHVGHLLFTSVSHFAGVAVCDPGHLSNTGEAAGNPVRS